MEIHTSEIEEIARLARLTFSEAEMKRLAGEMGAILTYFEKLNEIDTTGIVPLSHPHQLMNVMREDEVGESLSPSDALQNAPLAENGFFKVPRVI